MRRAKRCAESGSWWSQEEGLGLFLVIDRFVPELGSAGIRLAAGTRIDLLRKRLDRRHRSAAAKS